MEERADRFWRTEFPAKRHCFKKQKVRFADGTKTTSAHRVLRKANTRLSTSLLSMGEKLDQAPNDIDNRTISTTSPTNTSRARVGEKETNPPTSTTTSTSQWQRDQDSTCDSELGKLVGARTNNHSTTRSIPDTAVYPNYSDPNSSSSGSSMHPRRGACQGYQDPVERQVRQ